MTGVERYITAARDAGCPKDQVDFLLRAGIILKPNQLPVVAAYRTCDRRGGPKHIGLGGALGGGKSFVSLVCMIDDAIRFPGYKGLVLRKDLEAARDGMNALIPQVLGGGGLKYSWAAKVLRFANGSAIQVGHFQTEGAFSKYLGLEFDGAWIDECTQLEGDKKYIKIVTRLRNTRADLRPRIISSTNPLGIGHQFYKEKFVDPWEQGIERDTRYFHFGRDDTLLGEDYYSDLGQTLVGDQRKAWYDGSWDVNEGVFFKNFNPKVHVLDPDAIEPRADWEYWISFDHGWSHWSSCYLFGKDPRTQVTYALDEFAARGDMIIENAHGIREMVRQNGVEWGRLKCKVAGVDIWADRKGQFEPSAHSMSIQAEYSKHGVTFSKARTARAAGANVIIHHLGNPKLVDGQPALGYIEPSLYISGKCPKLVRQLPTLIHHPNNGEDVKKVHADSEGRGGDDFYDAFRYGCMEIDASRTVKSLRNPLAGFR